MKDFGEILHEEFNKKQEYYVPDEKEHIIWDSEINIADEIDKEEIRDNEYQDYLDTLEDGEEPQSLDDFCDELIENGFFDNYEDANLDDIEENILPEIDKQLNYGYLMLCGGYNSNYPDFRPSGNGGVDFEGTQEFRNYVSNFDRVAITSTDGILGAICGDHDGTVAGQFYTLPENLRPLAEAMNYQDQVDIEEVDDETNEDRWEAIMDQFEEDILYGGLDVADFQQHLDLMQPIKDTISMYGQQTESKKVESKYIEIDSKQVEDTDGFTTDYTMYYDNDNKKYVFVFGDKDIHKPEDKEFDYEEENEDVAKEWFKNYKGFNENQYWNDVMYKAAKDLSKSSAISNVSLNGKPIKSNTEKIVKKEAVENTDEINLNNIKDILRKSGIVMERTLDLMSKDILKDLKNNYKDDCKADGIYYGAAITDAIQNKVAQITGKRPSIKVGESKETKIEATDTDAIKGTVGSIVDDIMNDTLKKMNKYIRANHLDTNKYKADKFRIRMKDVPPQTVAGIVTEYNGRKYGFRLSTGLWVVTLIPTGASVGSYFDLKEAVDDLPRLDTKVSKYASQIDTMTNKFNNIQKVIDDVYNAKDANSLKSAVTSIDELPEKAVKDIIDRIDNNLQGNYDEVDFSNVQDMVISKLQKIKEFNESKKVESSNRKMYVIRKDGKDKIFSTENREEADAKIKELRDADKEHTYNLLIVRPDVTINDMARELYNDAVARKDRWGKNSEN